MKNKKGLSTVVTSLIITLLILIGLGVVGLTINYLVKVINNDCLKDIAQDYCEDKGLVFRNIDSKHLFSCKEDYRSTGIYKKYRFTKEERVKCLK